MDKGGGRKKNYFICVEFKAVSVDTDRIQADLPETGLYRVRVRQKQGTPRNSMLTLWTSFIKVKSFENLLESVPPTMSAGPDADADISIPKTGFPPTGPWFMTTVPNQESDIGVRAEVCLNPKPTMPSARKYGDWRSVPIFVAEIIGVAAY